MGGLDFDLATVAGLAGLGGSTVAALSAAFFFRGLITRIFAQVLATTVLSFVGFIALFNALGFQIVPPKQVAGFAIPSGSDTFSTQSVPTTPPVEQGYTIKSPWRKD
ncbi:MAG: hypothetical protein ABMA14_24545 [Hyphomonadaceae bacterium]|jgi:hypothetical protein